MHILIRLFLQLLFILVALAASVYFLYIPVTDGVVHLKRAKSESSLMRQGPNAIHHIRADTFEMAIYT